MSVDRGEVGRLCSLVLQHPEVGDLKKGQQRRLKRCGQGAGGDSRELCPRGPVKTVFEGGEVTICI